MSGGEWADSAASIVFVYNTGENTLSSSSIVISGKLEYSVYVKMVNSD